MTSTSVVTDHVMATSAFKLCDLLLNLPLMHEVLFGLYRLQTKLTAKRIGVPWNESIKAFRQNLPKLEEYRQLITSQCLTIPEYYFVTTHAYKAGNLCWESAMEEDLWSMLIMAPLYNGNQKGHMLMREEWLNTCAEYVDYPVETITDLGCGTGLATFLMEKMFPAVKQVNGIDLSPYKLAICTHKLTEMPPEQARKYSFHHCRAEDASAHIEANTQDLVSLCNVVHESPKPVAENIFAEVYRILRSGGIFTVLDVDQNNMESLLTNPLLAALFNRTEPYIGDYLTMNYSESLSRIGFEICELKNVCASHKAIIARKP